MSDPQFALKRWFNEKTAPHGIKTRLAEETGFTPTQISRMRNIEADDPKKRQEIPIEMIAKAARFFNELPPGFQGMTQWLDDNEPTRSDDESTVPIMGFIGAGAEIEPDYEQVPPEGLDEVTIPFAVPPDLIGFKVRGTSMLPVYRDGTVVLVYREQKRSLHTFYGEDAAVRTEAGRRFIKTIMRGHGDTVTLTSWNAEPIEDQRLEWIGEIFAVLPPSVLRRVEKQGGIQGSLRLKTA